MDWEPFIAIVAGLVGVYVGYRLQRPQLVTAERHADLIDALSQLNPSSSHALKTAGAARLSHLACPASNGRQSEHFEVSISALTSAFLYEASKMARDAYGQALLRIAQKAPGQKEGILAKVDGALRRTQIYLAGNLGELAVMVERKEISGKPEDFALPFATVHVNEEENLSLLRTLTEDPEFASAVKCHRIKREVSKPEELISAGKLLGEHVYMNAQRIKSLLDVKQQIESL